MLALNLDDAAKAKAIAQQLLQEGILINRTHETVFVSCHLHHRKETRGSSHPRARCRVRYNRICFPALPI